MANRNMNDTEVVEFLKLAFDGNNDNIDLRAVNQTMVPITPIGRIAARCCKSLLIAANIHWAPCDLLDYLNNAKIRLSEQANKLCDTVNFSNGPFSNFWPLNEKFGRCLEVGYQGYNASKNNSYCLNEGSTTRSDFPDSFCPAQVENVTTSEFLCENFDDSTLSASALITGMASGTFVLGLLAGSAATGVGCFIYKKWNDNRNYAAALQSEENLEKSSMLDTF